MRVGVGVGVRVRSAIATMHKSKCNNGTGSICIIIISAIILLSFCNQANASYGNPYFTSTEKNQFLASQNAARAARNEPPLVWSNTLAAYAQWYAQQRRWDCELEHSHGPYGENLFWGGGSGWTPAQAVSDWLSEGKWYDHSTNSCAGGQMCGHYTQIVWGGTRSVGCARVDCYDGLGVFITCNYDPPGNYMGEKPY